MGTLKQEERKMTQLNTTTSPKDWNDLWQPHNKERWIKKAAERANCAENRSSAEAVNRPMDWDMWQPSKKR